MFQALNWMVANENHGEQASQGERAGARGGLSLFFSRSAGARRTAPPTDGLEQASKARFARDNPRFSVPL